MSPTNLFTPASQHIGPVCPTHGHHDKGWLNYAAQSSNNAGIAYTFQVCGLCVIGLLRRIGYTVIEPENQTLKENDWILDELPEIENEKS